jgi:uncharacterized membrane protein YdbT with pleckstrin-like domain
MEEKILYERHPSMWRNNPFWFLVAVVTIPVGIGLAVLFVWWLRCKATTLAVTRESTTLRTGIFSKHTSTVYHADVRNVQIDQSLLQRMFGVGAIGISSAAQSDMEIMAVGMPTPGAVKEIIDTYRRNHRGPQAD